MDNNSDHDEFNESGFKPVLENDAFLMNLEESYELVVEKKEDPSF